MSLFKLSILAAAALSMVYAQTTPIYIPYCLTVAANTTQAQLPNPDYLDFTPLVNTDGAAPCLSTGGTDTNEGWACAPEKGECYNRVLTPVEDRAAVCLQQTLVAGSDPAEYTFTLVDVNLCPQLKRIPLERDAVDPACESDVICPAVIRRNIVLDADIHDISSTGSTVFIAGGHAEFSTCEWQGESILLKKGPIATIFKTLGKVAKAILPGK